MKTPKPFGFKISRHYKKRLAKKIIKQRGRNLWERWKQFHNYSGLISDCSGLNALPEHIAPTYVEVKSKSFVLYDIDIMSDTNSCSFYNCGIDLPKSYNECKEYVENIVNNFKDEWGYFERYSKLKLNPDGTFEW